jgi:PAS domain S-box-containing protein
MNRLEEKALYQALTQGGDAAFVVGAAGRIVLWNRAAERLLGYAAEEVIGRTCCELLTPRNGHSGDERSCVRDRRVTAAISQGQTVSNFDMKARTKAGQSIWLNVSTLALRREGASEALTIHLVRDVTAAHEQPAAGESTNGESNGVGVRTPREREVLRLLAGGANTRRAAERLGVSPATVRNHVQNMFGKLGVHSRLQAVAYANSHGLL